MTQNGDVCKCGGISKVMVADTEGNLIHMECGKPVFDKLLKSIIKEGNDAK